MEQLFQFSASRINSVQVTFKRYLWQKINWKNRLIAITGARGVGKTTLLLQHIKENLSDRRDEVIYLNLDDLYFSKHSIVEFADEFVKRGGKYLFLDEVHKYMDWSREIKNVYDYFSDLQIIITGSSTLDIYRGSADLSRRAVLYKMNGLSFREFIELKYSQKFPVLSLEQILLNPRDYIQDVLNEVKPIRLFEEYLQSGFYPFFTEGESEYLIRLKQTINHVLENDMPNAERIDYYAIHHLRKLFSILAELVPYKPNIVNLSKQVGVSRETLLKYLNLLDKAELVLLLQSQTTGISKMNKPEKIYLNNSNLSYALASGPPNQGTIRETFFYNQLKTEHIIESSDIADFYIDKKYTLEIGGKNKTRKQIAVIKNAFIAADNIEFSQGNKIPLWLFGFLY